jgi:hypothetical protein
MTKLFLLIAGGVVVCTLCTTLILQTNIQSVATVFLSQNSEKYSACIQTFSNKSLDSFTITQTHLNNDTKIDALIEQTDKDACGTAGCVYEICLSTNDGSFTHVPFGYAAKKITVRETLTNNMYDLMLNDEKKLKMTWDGTRYVLAE